MKDLSRPKSFLQHFPTPEYLSLSNTGVAIDEEGVRLIELKRPLFARAYKLSQYKKVALPEGAVQSGFIHDTGKLGAALHELAESTSSFYVRATLPEEKAYLFSAYIHKVPEDSVRDAVAFIIEENVPLSLSESVFDYNVISGAPEAEEIKVVVSVLPKKVVSSYTEVLEKAGLVPVSFDIESQAIARALVPWGEKTTHLIVNLSKKKTGFYVAEDGVVQFTTTAPYGSDQAEHLNDLKTEMRKIFAFWSARTEKPGFPDRKIEKVIVSGSGSLDNSFVAELMSECAIKYELGGPWVNLFGGKGGVPAEFSHDSLEYVPAIGLALPRAPK